jgi:hypothetical protein
MCAACKHEINVCNVLRVCYGSDKKHMKDGA